MRKKVKCPNVSGSFYPKDINELRNLLKQYFSIASDSNIVPKAIIAPHAGYIYSGEIAANGYQLLNNINKNISRVVILSPTHYYPINSIAVSSADYFETPLGNIEVDQPAIQKLIANGSVEYQDQAFEREHALEVHLPFLQYKLDHFKLVPIIVGQVTPEKVLPIFESFDTDETLFVVSTDLSHFHDYQTCQEIDSNTTQIFSELDYSKLNSDNACGYYPLKGLFMWAQKNGYQLETIDQRNSGDTAGDREHVVGYGSYAIY